MAPYCATKFAVRGYTEVLMAEMASSHIQIHLVHPGGIDTNISRSGRVVEQRPAPGVALARGTAVTLRLN